MNHWLLFGVKSVLVCLFCTFGTIASAFFLAKPKEVETIKPSCTFNEKEWIMFSNMGNQLIYFALALLAIHVFVYPLDPMQHSIAILYIGSGLIIISEIQLYTIKKQNN